MKKFFTSDIHFDDNRLELFGRDILFKNSDEFDKQIIENWNSVVGENDVVYCLGDVSLSEKGLKNISKCNGKKILIKGNYDEESTAKYKVSDDLLKKYFYKIYKSGYIKIKNERIYLNHYPNKGKKDCFNIVGHIHGGWRVQKNMINVGLDAWNYFPISENKIIFYMNAIRKFYDDNVFAGELECNLKFDYQDKKVEFIKENKDIKNLVFPPKIIKNNKKTIFLAGPIQGTSDWQTKFANKISNKISSNYEIASPRMEYKPSEFDYDKQVDWETEYLTKASKNGLIVFWLANEEEHDPKRCYAQTTRFELATWLERQKNSNGAIKIAIGIDKNFSGGKYIIKKIEEEYLDIENIYDNMDDLIEHVIEIAK